MRRTTHSLPQPYLGLRVVMKTQEGVFQPRVSLPHPPTTQEMRAACQQPWHERHAAVALNVGLVCAAPAIAELFEARLGSHQHAWPLMQDYYQRVVRDGLAADEPAEGLLRAILERCADALQVSSLVM